MTASPQAARKILVADDDAAIRTVLSHALRGAGYEVECTDNAATLYEWASAGAGDLVITDVKMPGASGLDLLPRLRARRPDLQVIVISAQNMLTTAVAASERGAMEFLPKPFDVDELLQTVGRAFTRRKSANVNAPEVDTAAAMDKSIVVGQSRAMQEVYRSVARLRDSDLTVLITGESGTGKEMIARALHVYSHRKSGPFIAINVAAIPHELIESELFGHEKGAFTGAVQRHMGRFEQAAGGTLFLDEIGDMPLAAQTRLLRVLQEGEFSTVGGSRPQRTNVRVIAASHHDLAASVKAGRFREDLYYRLNVIPLKIPPLRDRPEDIPALAQHFLAGSNKLLTPEAVALLQKQAWKGNIRELENAVKRLAALSSAPVIDADAVANVLPGRTNAVLPAESDDLAGILQAAIRRHFAGVDAADLARSGHIYDDIMALAEKPLLQEALRLTRGNQIRAAALLGLNRNTLRARLRALGIDVAKGGDK